MVVREAEEGKEGGERDIADGERRTGLTVVNVAWQPGKSALTLSATTTYSYDSVSSDNQDLSLPYAWLK